MTFHDFGFSEYERQKRTKQDWDGLMLTRRTLLNTQSPARWINLQGEIRGCIVRLNIGAGRTVLGEHQESDNCLAMRREDGRTFKAIYDPEQYCVSFSGSELRELKLTVRQMNGKVTTVWVDPQTGKICQVDEIARSLINAFLREI